MTKIDSPDVIIVGAGPAGSSAALKLAQEGLKVVLVERAMPLGSKNLSGGVIWGNDLAELIPDWQTEAPVERAILNKKIGFLSDEDATVLDLHFDSWNKKPYPGMSVLRVVFDEWLALKAEEAGAIVLSGIMVDSLIMENSKVVGIKQGDEELYAPVVILAEGVNARLMLKHRFYKDSSKSRLEPKEVLSGYKEVYLLDQSILEERFMLEGNQGVAAEFILGNVPGNALAGGFFYTNKNTLSLGVIVHADSLDTEDRGYKAIEYFKSNPYIKRLIKGAELVEYGSKLVPEMGIKGFPNFYGDGWMVVGDAAGFVFSNGLLIQGINYAIKSGILAAETVIEAKKKNNFSKSALKLYEKKLKESYILKDFKRFKKVKELTKNPRLFKKYPDVINSGLREYLTERGDPKENLIKTLRKALKKSGVSLISLLKDGLKARHI